MAENHNNELSGIDKKYQKLLDEKLLTEEADAEEYEKAEKKKQFKVRGKSIGKGVLFLALTIICLVLSSLFLGFTIHAVHDNILMFVLFFVAIIPFAVTCVLAGISFEYFAGVGKNGTFIVMGIVFVLILVGGFVCQEVYFPNTPSSSQVQVDENGKAKCPICGKMKPAKEIKWHGMCDDCYKNYQDAEKLKDEVDNA